MIAWYFWLSQLEICGLPNKMKQYTEKLHTIDDEKMQSLKRKFFEEPQKVIARDKFIDQAHNWFLSTKLNTLHGVEKFDKKDIIIGCTQYIETLALKNKWNIQILPKEYAYYSVMGKRTTNAGELQPKVPLIVSIPNYFYGHRPEWQDLLKECEQKEIDIHIDCAWMVAAKDIELDFDHPNIKSFAMSMSKYIGQWNRIGLRWSKQKTMDSITLFNVQNKYNEALVSCGSMMMDNIERDYGWNTYGEKYQKLCEEMNLEQTKFFYVAKKDGVPVGLSNALVS